MCVRAAPRSSHWLVACAFVSRPGASVHPLAVEPAAEVHSMAKSRKKSVETTPTSGSPQRAAISSQDAGTATAVVERDRIAERAYELYIRRGGGSGRELDDWLAAERELTLSSRGNGGE
jgi:hypothetical protein